MNIWSNLTSEDFQHLDTCALDNETARIVGFFCTHGPLSPDVSKWQAGDVIISMPNVVVSPVAAYHRMLEDDGQKWRWTHVGIYDGSGFVWDANPDVHVQENALGDFIVRRKGIRLLRPQKVDIDPHELIGVLQDLSEARYDLTSMASSLAY